MASLHINFEWLHALGAELCLLTKFASLTACTPSMIMTRPLADKFRGIKNESS